MEKIYTSDLNDLQITKLESELVLNCLDFEIMILNQDFKIIFANDAISEIEEKTKILEKTKKDLQAKINQLELFNKVTVGRELKMLELKKKIEDLEKKIK